MPDYIALTPILHDGDTVKPGAPLSLTETEAAPLITLKAVEPAKKPTPKTKTEGTL